MQKRELKRLLSSDQPRHERALKIWLRLTPDHTVADLLAAVAEKRHESSLASVAAWQLLLLLLLIFVLGVWFLANPVFFVYCAVVFGVSFYLGIRPRQAMIQRRAALLLASLGDTRAIGPLVRVWRPNPATADDQAVNCLVESHLTQLLTEITTNRAVATVPTATALTLLLKRVAHDWRRNARWDGNGIELTDSRADMLLAVLCFMARTKDARYHRMLAEFAALPVADAASNRQIVRDAAVMGIEYQVERQRKAEENGTPAKVGVGKIF